MKYKKGTFHEKKYKSDFCVIGGGMAGLCAALAASRHGLRVVLMHERPVLGGNASSECRVHICGADRHGLNPNMRETGILEELRLKNLYHNPQRNFSIWDAILYNAIKSEPNITLLLNCSCLDVQMEENHIKSVIGWQLTTQTWHIVSASIFADCSGDAVLAPLSGAQFRMGREGREEYGESIAPEKADSCTMGMTCMFQAKKYDTPQPFESPIWAYCYKNDNDLPYGRDGHKWLECGYWWIELGGENDSIHDTEKIRDELLKIVFGLWDHLKNHGNHGAENWSLDWIQFLPAKRESRRYIGDHVLTQGDIESEGRFDDMVAYGGWPMDDHHPAGFKVVKTGCPATIMHPVPSPYGIPYRSLYSKNIENLMFAGRCASYTHVAMSSTRIQGTGCITGQAVGAAAAIAIHRGLMPGDILHHIPELQQKLLNDDCYLPWVTQHYRTLTMQSRLIASQGDPEPVRDGINRPVGHNMHAWECTAGDSLEYRFKKQEKVQTVTIVLDSALDQLIAMSYHNAGHDHIRTIPGEMPKKFHQTS